VVFILIVGEELSVLDLSFADGIMEGNEELCVLFTSLVGRELIVESMFEAFVEYNEGFEVFIIDEEFGVGYELVESIFEALVGNDEGVEVFIIDEEFGVG
jgi:hypothetical protein